MAEHAIFRLAEQSSLGKNGVGEEMNMQTSAVEHSYILRLLSGPDFSIRFRSFKPASLFPRIAYCKA